MNEDQRLIVDTAARIFTDLSTKEVVDASEEGEWAVHLWQAIEECGLSLAGIPEALGGSGGQLSDSLLVLREAAKYAAPIPLAETFIASSLLAEIGIASPEGAISVGFGELEFNLENNAVHISGHLDAVPYASHCEHWLFVNKNQICLLPRQDASKYLNIIQDKNLAGEPRARLQIIQSVEAAQLYEFANVEERLQQLGAMARVQMMSGAMTSMLDLSVNYSLERIQFGRPIARFQAVQQQLAILAGEVAACQRAADSLLGDSGLFNIAVAKARVGEAVTQVADIAHQVHGAMGYTLEHPLNLRSRRLWCWRDEYGNESYWQRRLGAEICMDGADNLWARVTEI